MLVAETEIAMPSKKHIGISGGAGKAAIVGMKQRKGETRAKVMNEVTKVQ